MRGGPGLSFKGQPFQFSLSLFPGLSGIFPFQLFQAKFGQYQQKYGPEGAARAWFAGEGGMNNRNATDVLGTTVGGYGQKFAQAYGPGAMGGPQVGQGAPPQAMPPQIAQGSADGTPPAPSPQGVQGPTMTAPPQIPQRMTPRDMPPQLQQQYVQKLRRGGYGRDPAVA